ncbi:receptor-like protein EIX1 [Cajanus cajan]|uniref:receptor-like protein EIX1 n=1 Tax=Cajanus cajan TaxID=3821 RepID=UPI0010FB4497|nr:receptor-like protein EIX1 [Cajanus cajan]
MASQMTLACCLHGRTMTITVIVAYGKAFSATMKLVTYTCFNSLVGNLPNLHTVKLASNVDLKISDAKCLTDKIFLVPYASIKKRSSSLVTLDLAYNLLKSSDIFHWIFNFTPNLHSIYLDQNLLEGPIPDRFGKAMNSLEVLRLGTNKLKGTIPASLGNLCTLQELHLYNNNLSGGISSFIHNISWCNRHKFQSLNLSHDLAIGMLPNHSILSSLRALDLSRNQLTGEIPKSIGLLHDLDYLYLNGNNLEGDITETHFTNLSKLRVLDLSDNSFSLKVGTTWVPPFQLFRLGLASCKLGPTFPRWLQTQSQIEFLDISDAGIDDFVPEWFWNNLRSLCQMNMSCNNLKGTIPDLPIMFAGGNRNMLIRSSNKLEGGIPTFLKQADSLDLSKDKITDLKTFLCGKNITTEMRTLDLSKNQIMGQLPDCWEHLTSLRYLDLSNNKLSGNIFHNPWVLLFIWKIWSYVTTNYLENYHSH